MVRASYDCFQAPTFVVDSGSTKAAQRQVPHGESRRPKKKQAQAVTTDDENKKAEPVQVQQPRTLMAGGALQIPFRAILWEAIALGLCAKKCPLVA